MTDVPGQLTFEGREVSASKAKWGELGEQDYIIPDGGRTPQPGDKFRTVVEWVCVAVNHPEKHDSDGNATDNLKRVAVMKPLVSGFEITGVQTREDRLAQWDKAHSA